MKAKQFIQVALVDQMQQIADFKAACLKVIAGIDAGELQDIEIIKNLKQ